MNFRRTRTLLYLTTTALVTSFAAPAHAAGLGEMGGSARSGVITVLVLIAGAVALLYYYFDEQKRLRMEACMREFVDVAEGVFAGEQAIAAAKTPIPGPKPLPPAPDSEPAVAKKKPEPLFEISEPPAGEGTMELTIDEIVEEPLLPRASGRLARGTARPGAFTAHKPAAPAMAPKREQKPHAPTRRPAAARAIPRISDRFKVAAAPKPQGT